MMSECSPPARLSPAAAPAAGAGGDMRPRASAGVGARVGLSLRRRWLMIGSPYARVLPVIYIYIYIYIFIYIYISYIYIYMS